jgi:hypothetical protein
MLPVLGLMAIALVMRAAGADSHQPPPVGTWVVDPIGVESDLPPVGRSLFDRLIARGNGYEVPFPFEVLLNRVREAAGSNAVRALLIPRGRSLQRHAAAPDFFRFPRAVVAVDRHDPDAKVTLNLKDRLFIGYHETAAVLEIISYNELAGRFEFQLVKDYRPGGEPQVLYAKRAICRGCHQNGAPIFSRPLWRETNADPDTAKSLSGRRNRFYGIPARGGTDESNAMDEATDRANQIAAYQLIWRQGCALDQEAASRRCRAELLNLALRYRLSGRRGVDADALARLLPTLADAFARRWPHGLLLPNPDIPNRVVDAPKGIAAPAPAAAINWVAWNEDPLTPRAPFGAWREMTDGVLAQVVTGLSDFLTEADVRNLDDALRARARTVDTGKTHVTLACAATGRTRPGGHRRLSLRCTGENGGSPDWSAALRLYFRENELDRVVIDRLSRGADDTLLDMPIKGAQVDTSDRRHRISWPTDGVTDGIARPASRWRDGTALESLTVSWSASEPESDTGRTDARLEIVQSDDTSALGDALVAMTGPASADTPDVLGAGPFDGTAAMSTLFGLLGLDRAPCCALAASLPPPETDGNPPPLRVDADDPNHAALQAFYRRCAGCHLSAETFPPNFLQGNRATVDRRLGDCAPRIAYRLGLWSMPEARRPQMPMPPPLAIRAAGLEVNDWLASEDYALLRSYAANRVGQAGHPGSLTEHDRTLRACIGQPG